MKREGMSIVCVRSVNFKFWVHSGCSVSKSILFGREGHDVKFFYFSFFSLIFLGSISHGEPTKSSVIDLSMVSAIFSASTKKQA